MSVADAGTPRRMTFGRWRERVATYFWFLFAHCGVHAEQTAIAMAEQVSARAVFSERATLRFVFGESVHFHYKV